MTLSFGSIRNSNRRGGADKRTCAVGTITAHETQQTKCKACGLENRILINYAPAAAEEWTDADCYHCGATLLRMKCGLLRTEPASPKPTSPK
jgi:hypothetical protein